MKPVSALHKVLIRHGIDPDDIRCGADCGDGWAPIVDRMLVELEALGWTGEIVQLKQKFALLTVYLTKPTDNESRCTGRAMSASATVCERCGVPGSLHIGAYGYRLTLCDKCSALRGKK